MKPTVPAAAGTPAPTALSQAAEAKKDVQALQALPIGWTSSRFVGTWDQGVGTFTGALAFALMGWIITAFASSLGAPFWFDGIGWLLALRGSGAKPATDPAPVVIETITLPSLNGVKPTNG